MTQLRHTTRLLEMADEAGAIYRIDGTVLINRDIFDEYAEYRMIKEENKELQMAKHNLERFLNQQEEEQKEKEKQHNKSGQSL